MKKLLLSSAIAFMANWNFAQEFDWVRTISGTGIDFVGSVKSDAQGNLISSGQFAGIVDFDPGTAVVNLDAGDFDGIYLSKSNSAGDLIWAKSITGEDIMISGQAVDNQGNIYISGTFSTLVNFGAESGNLSFTTVGGSDVFVAKYNSSGGFLWAKTIGGTNVEECEGIVVDAQNNVVIYGKYKGTVDFDPGQTTFNLTSSAVNKSAYILTLSSDGNFVRASDLTALGNGTIDIRNAALDNSGNLTYIGDLNGTVDFDPNSENASLTSTGIDAFIFKYSPNGSFVWAQNIGGAGVDAALGLAIDNNDNILITGIFNGTTDLDPSSAVYPLTTTGSSSVFDFFVAKYDNVGNFIWGHKFGGVNNDYAFTVATDGIGNVYLAGNFYGTVDFDPHPTNTFNLTGQDGDRDVYILKLRSNGDFAWAGMIDGTGQTSAAEIMVDNSYSIYVCGDYRLTADFDPNSGTESLTAVGIVEDGFLLKLTQCVPDLREDVVTSCGAYTWIDGITYTTNNNSAALYFQNAQGCDSVITLNLTVSNEVLEATTVVSNYTIFANVPNASYQWINCANNAAIDGETAQVFVASTNGDYAVIVSRNGCSDTSACVTISSLNLAEIDASELSVFPNPTTDFINVSCSSCQLSSITIFNTIGQIVLHKENIDVNTTLDIADFAKGIYQLQIETSNKTINKRIIKQ